MSKTACWATNESFDCAWVYFGYGSGYDMTFMYHKGVQLSKEGLRILLMYDYPLHEMQLLTWEGVSWQEQMKDSYIHIEHPEAESWFAFAKEVAGSYAKQYPEKYFERHRGFEWWTTPWHYEVKDINLEHFKAINRVKEICESAWRNQKVADKFWFDTTKYPNECLVEWNSIDGN